MNDTDFGNNHYLELKEFVNILLKIIKHQGYTNNIQFMQVVCQTRQNQNSLNEIAK